MKNKNIGILILVAIVFFGGGFIGGEKYNQHTAQATNVASRQGTGMGQYAGSRTGGTRAGGGMFAGATRGEIIAHDATSITVKLVDGGSKIILVSPSTTVMKSTAGTAADLAIGAQVNVLGASNTDGSITAQSIQLGTATKPSATVTQ